MKFEPYFCLHAQNLQVLLTANFAVPPCIRVYLCKIKVFEIDLFSKRIELLIYRMAAPRWVKVQNWLPIKNPQFFSKYHESWSILAPHEYIILTKFHNVWRKIVDFLLIAKFEPCPTSEQPPCKCVASLVELQIMSLVCCSYLKDKEIDILIELALMKCCIDNKTYNVEKKLNWNVV